MQYRLLARKALFAFLITLLVGCASIHQKTDLPVDSLESESIVALVNKKELAVNSNQLKFFMEQIDTDNKEYFIEQIRWFQYYQNASVSNYVLEIEDIAKRNSDTYAAVVKQSYDYGLKKKIRKISYTGKFVRKDNGWKDSDLEFKVLETDHFIFKATTGIGKKRLDRIASQAEKAYAKVVTAYGEGTVDKTVVKLYGSKIIRDLTIVSSERSFMSGWYEYPESIKIFVDKTKVRDLTKTFAHELVHKITLSTSTNLCAWFAEGLAMYYGSFNIYGKTYIGMGWLPRFKHYRSIKWLEKQDYGKLDGWKELGPVYGIAGMVILFIEDSFGKGRSIEILKALKKYPQRGNEGFEHKIHNAQYVEYLNQAIMEVLGMDMQTFDDKWQAWIRDYNEKQYLSNLRVLK